MKLMRLLCVTLVSVLVAISRAAPVAAQDESRPGSQAAQPATQTDEQAAAKEREKKALALLGDVVKEIGNVRLPENRMSLYGQAGDLLWTHDEKRARNLLKEAINAYWEVSRRLERSSASTSYNGPMVMRFSSMNLDVLGAGMARVRLKQEIVQVLMRHDPRWAREFLNSTRSNSGSGDVGNMLASADASEDIELAGQLAGTDPKQALDIIESSLDRIFQTGNAANLIDILQQMRIKDGDTASKLADDLMKRIRAGNLAEDAGLAMFAASLVQAATQAGKGDATQKKGTAGSGSTAGPPQLLDEPMLKDIVDRLAAAFLARNLGADGIDRAGPYYSLEQSVLPAIEKYAPSRAAAVRDRIAETAKVLDPGAQVFAELTDQEDPSADAILKIAAKAPEGMRESLYVQAVQKSISEGDFDGARQLINDHVSDNGQRDALLGSIDRQRLSTATEQGKADEVRQLLAQIDAPEERVVYLTQLASQLAAKGNKKMAIELLAEARGQISGPVDSNPEFEAVLQLATAMAAVDSAQGFDVLEGTMDGLVRIIDASAVLDGFQGRQQFRDGEMLVRGNGLAISLMQRWSTALEALARTDVDRARLAVDRFTRPEVKAALHLAVASGVLSDGSGKRERPQGQDFRFFSPNSAMVVDRN